MLHGDGMKGVGGSLRGGRGARLGSSVSIPRPRRWKTMLKTKLGPLITSHTYSALQWDHETLEPGEANPSTLKDLCLTRALSPAPTAVPAA